MDNRNHSSVQMHTKIVFFLCIRLAPSTFQYKKIERYTGYALHISSFASLNIVLYTFMNISYKKTGDKSILVEYNLFHALRT